MILRGWRELVVRGWLVPGVAFVVLDGVFVEQDAEFVLEGVFAVMFFLRLDVVEKRIEGGWGGGEGRVAALPGEVA